MEVAAGILTAAAVTTLVAGILTDGLTLIVVSIGTSVAAGASLIASVVRRTTPPAEPPAHDGDSDRMV